MKLLVFIMFFLLNLHLFIPNMLNGSREQNNNDLPGVVQAHSGVFAAFYRCVSKVAHRGLRGCARASEMQHIREKTTGVKDNTAS